MHSAKHPEANLCVGIRDSDAGDGRLVRAKWAGLDSDLPATGKRYPRNDNIRFPLPSKNLAQGDLLEMDFPSRPPAACEPSDNLSRALGEEPRQVSKRGGELFCQLAHDRVRIAGRAALYLEGMIKV